MDEEKSGGVEAPADKKVSTSGEMAEIRIDNEPDRSGVSKFAEKAKSNPWVLSTIVLGIVSLILIIVVMNGGITGNVIGGTDAGNILVGYLNEATGGGVEYMSHLDLGNLYEVSVSYEGQRIPVYITKDGKYLIQGAIPIGVVDLDLQNNPDVNQDTGSLRGSPGIDDTNNLDDDSTDVSENRLEDAVSDDVILDENQLNR